MEEEKEKQMNVDVVDTPEGQSEMEQMAEVSADGNKTSTSQEDFAPLFENAEAEEFRSHWLEIQSRFVDDPSASVKEADELVANVIKSITRSFADKRMSLENQWKSGENNISTEDMRVAIKRYRSFFNRLLSLES
jgi:hypothetical protein